VKIAAGVGVELRQIYLPRRCSHHPNNAPQQTSLNPNYRMEERDPPSLLPLERQAEGEGTNANAGDLRIWKLGHRRMSLEEGEAKTVPVPGDLRKRIGMAWLLTD
jgi:hypothetical protein